MQLQGEMGHGKKVYKGLFQGLRLIYVNEGIRGVQKGLGAAVG